MRIVFLFAAFGFFMTFAVNLTMMYAYPAGILGEGFEYVLFIASPSNLLLYTGVLGGGIAGPLTIAALLNGLAYASLAWLVAKVSAGYRWPYIILIVIAAFFGWILFNLLKAPN